MDPLLLNIKKNSKAVGFPPLKLFKFSTVMNKNTQL